MEEHFRDDWEDLESYAENVDTIRQWSEIISTRLWLFLLNWFQDEKSLLEIRIC